MGEIIYKKESYAIIGACFEVYNEKGADFWNRFTKSAWRSSLNVSGFRQSVNRLASSAIVAAY
jgi:hypothetical protein